MSKLVLYFGVEVQDDAVRALREPLYNVMNSLNTPSTSLSLRQKVITGTMCSALPCISLVDIQPVCRL